MLNLLVDNKINRVDLVTEGCCSIADILLIKGKDGANMPEIVQQVFAKMKPELAEAIKEHYNSEISKAVSDKEAKIAELEKACTDKDEAIKKLETSEDEDKKEKDAKIAELEKACKDKDEIIEKLKAPKEEPKDEFEEVLKGVPENMAEYFKKMKASNDELIAKAKEQEAAKEHAEAVIKAKEFEALPVDANEMVEIIKSKPSDVIMNALSALAKAAADSEIFKSYGSEAGGASGDVKSIVDSKAKEVMKTKQITIEKARLQVLTEEPELYAKYYGGDDNE